MKNGLELPRVRLGRPPGGHGVGVVVCVLRRRTSADGEDADQRVHKVAQPDRRVRPADRQQDFVPPHLDHDRLVPGDRLRAGRSAGMFVIATRAGGESVNVPY